MCPLAMGADSSPSSSGEFQAVSRVSNPTYYHPGTVIPSGKDSPIGTRSVGLSKKGYGIHGTNAPKSVGHAVFHGCMRACEIAIEQPFTMLRVGDMVQLRGVRDQQVAHIFGGNVDHVTAHDATVLATAAGNREFCGFREALCKWRSHSSQWWQD
jgi:hypothetical protein